jgi:hypothetical protein
MNGTATAHLVMNEKTGFRRMSMRASRQLLAVCAIAGFLAGCGGSGSGDDNAFTPPPPTQQPNPWTIGFEVPNGVTSLPANTARIPPELRSPYYAQLNIRVLRANGAAVPDGTNVNITTSNVRNFALGRLDDPSTADVNEFTQLFGTVNATTVGGLATFFIHSLLEPGQATITAAVQDTDRSTQVTNAFNFTIGPGPQPFARIAIEPVRTVLPANIFAIGPFFGSPYLAETTVTRRDVFGDLIPSGTMQVAVTPVSNSGWSELDRPETTQINEFLQIIGAGPVNFVAGRHTLFIHSIAQTGVPTTPGPVTLTITAVDPTTGATLSKEQVYQIAAQAPTLPAEITLSRPAGGLYVQGSGGRNTMPFQAEVRDGSGALIPDPPAGATFNNLQYEIIDQGTAGGEVFRGINGAGQNVEGRSIRVRTQAGIGLGTLVAGNRQGTFQVRVTADAADNNVDNGIQSATTRVAQIIISDGRLFSLKITSPDVNALRINRVSPGVAPVGGSATIPPDPNGTYSLTVSVLATDRQGNPVLPGTPIDFGVIDAPAAGFPSQGEGNFLLTGNDGDPQEGGTLFTAPTGAFTSAGGGAGPGDTLIVFGEQSNPNRDLESARRVERVNGATSLNVTTRFNFNDDTGVPVNNGPVLPYVIGRASVANITPNVLTNDIGVATTTLNYPLNQLGRLAAIWARGAGEVVQGSSELVTDAEYIVFPGAAPGRLVASPSQIAANRTTSVVVCVQDALAAPIQGVPIGFVVANPSTTTTVDGQSNEGVLNQRTGVNGCTSATVTTAGVANAAQAPSITFFGVGGSSVVTVVPPAISFLQAFPSSFFGGNGGPIRLRLFNGNGEPIPGVLIVGQCTAGNGGQLQLTTPPGITDSNGETTTNVLAINLDQPQGAASGTCTFSAAGGTPQTLVNFQGIDICQIFFSPLCN